MSELIAVSVLGADRPGIVADVAAILARDGLLVLDVSQTIVHGQFAGVFIARPATSVTETGWDRRVERELRDHFKSENVNAWAYLVPPEVPASTAQAEPWVVTSMGPDAVDVLARLTRVMAGRKANIVGLKAGRRGPDDRQDKGQAVLIFEVEIPESVAPELARELRRTAAELGHEISIQHRAVFESIHRI